MFKNQIFLKKDRFLSKLSLLKTFKQSLQLPIFCLQKIWSSSQIAKPEPIALTSY
jgi:hypothetical protein